MLEEILIHLHNRCAVQGAGLSGSFQISSGTLDLPQLQPGQFFWIVGSVFNDGLHQNPVSGLTDETFTGQIIPAAIPRALVALSEEISEWVSKHPADDKTSESFGGYSYTKGTDGHGAPLTWRSVFRVRLNPWRKLS